MFPCEVEGGQDVEEEHKELDLRPVLGPEGFESEIFVVHLECEPGPLHRPRLSLILVEVLERLSLLLRYRVELGGSVQLFLDLDLPVHAPSLAKRSTSQSRVLAGKSSLVPAELIDIGLLLDFLLPRSPSIYLAALREAR